MKGVSTVSAEWLGDLQARLTATHDLLAKLAVDNPWSWSTEGLDDCCTFCGGDSSTWHNSGHTYLHEPNCVWLEAREFLGLSQPEHVRSVPKASPTGDQGVG